MPDTTTTTTDPTTDDHDVDLEQSADLEHDVDVDVDDAEVDEHEDEGEGGDDDGDTFPRSVVEKLRKEAADARVRVKDRDALAAALWQARVTATGRLADPTDLPMPDGADPLNEDELVAAVDELLARKPHLTARVPRGNIGQGPASNDGDVVDLAGILRGRAS